MKILFFILCTIHSIWTFGQVSDFILVKKNNGRIIKSFSPNVNITFETFYNTYVSGPIMKIRNDSIYVKTFDIRQFMTTLGVTRVDTFNTYITPYYYKDIRSIKVYEKQSFIRNKADKLMMFGGAGYMILNVINSIYLKQPLTDPKNLTKMGLAASAFASGYIINRYFNANKNNGNRNKIEYVSMK